MTPDADRGDLTGERQPPDGRAGADGTESSDAASGASDDRLRRLALGARNLAFVLLLVGFYGAVTRDVSPIALDNPFGVAFLAGVACAIGSIYLGIFQHDGATGD